LAGSGALSKSINPLPKGKNPAAVMLGRLGGSKDGKARAKKLSSRKRIEIAKNGGD
jgi:hypothetical protein